MARIIPKSIQDRLNFFLVHAQDWAADPGAIGLTPGEIAALQEAYEAARDAAVAAREARLAAERATGEQTIRMAALVDMGAGLIAKIKAAAAGNPAVYTAASLDVPSGPTFTGIAPPSPEDFRCSPRRDGAVALSWTSDLKRTSFYRLERVLTVGGVAGRTTREFLAAVRDNAFTDESLPVGFTNVEYFLTPVHQRRNSRPNPGATRSATYTPGSVWPRVAATTTAVPSLAA
ncbi:MAG TPA: hypothetical protein PKE29_04515 [Phycisphaerales bacterium]|nr:hypothetical protein [Phycisphaerales bacterium]